MKWILLTMAVALGWSSIADAGNNIDPETLIKKTVGAMGGQAFKEMKSLSSRGTLTIKGADLKGTCTIHAKAPGMSRMAVRIADMMDSTEACDGKTAWDYNPFFAVFREKGENEAAYMLLHSRTDLLTAYKTHFSKWEITGTATIGDRVCHVLKLTPKNKVKPFLYYIDAETFLPRREKSVFDGPQGKFSIISDVDAYKKVKGVNVPEKLTIRMSQMDIHVQFSSIEVDGPVPDVLFKNPDALTLSIRQTTALEFEVGKDNPVTMTRKQLMKTLKTVNSVKDDFKIAAIELSGAPGVDPQAVLASSYWLRNLAETLTILETGKTDGKPAEVAAPTEEPTTKEGDEK